MHLEHPAPLFHAASREDVVALGARPAEPRISCVVPCLNEAANLRQLLPLLEKTLGALATQWEIILVDDGSTDGTALELMRWARRPGYSAIILSRNFGKEAALTAGLSESRGDAVLMLDADMQHSPDLVPQLFARWREGADIAYAVRAHREGEHAAKRLGSRLFYSMVNTGSRFRVPPDAGDFRLMDRAAVDALLALPERNRFMKGLYAWVGFEAVAVPYVPQPRAHGVSHFNGLRLMKLALDGLTAFTTLPLRALSATGLLLALAGFTYGGYLTVSYFVSGNDVSGWTTIVVGMMVFFGMQMVSMGILGEYIGRIFEEVKARPLYVVRARAGRGLGATGQAGDA